MVLLDLIGAPSPHFLSGFSTTHHLFKRLVALESKQHELGLLRNHSQPYFQAGGPFRLGIEDDHLPFLARNVPILHIIAAPFPAVWHTVDDDFDHVDHTVVENLLLIFHRFLQMSLK